MKIFGIRLLFLSTMIILLAAASYAEESLMQPAAVDTPHYVNPFEVVVTTTRTPLPLREIPSAISNIGNRELSTMPRGASADEALKLMPGVRVDNQYNGAQVHLSIRGQGILTERGVRGIKILLDGLPINDASGFAPDLYDVDWATVKEINVLRGPSASLYGGGSNGGVVDITTLDGRDINGADLQVTGGSNGFGKVLGQIGGVEGNLDYRISASRMKGDGYRDHTAFWGNNIYGKLHYQVSPKLRITPIWAWTEYYGQIAEGLNQAQMDSDRTQANPDAVPFDQFQSTARFTSGVTGEYALCEHQSLTFNAYTRFNSSRESVPSSVLHRQLISPGATAQYNRSNANSKLKNQLSLGVDASWQQIEAYKNKNLGYAREDTLLSQQDIFQRGVGIFVLDHLAIGENWSASGGVRWDGLVNHFMDAKADSENLSGTRSYEKATLRAGLAYVRNEKWIPYANYAQGFLPPNTEELENNPEEQGGFNSAIEEAESEGFEFGVRGEPLAKFTYDLSFFSVETEDEFGRYRVPDRPLETFYQSKGKSERTGFEALLTWNPLSDLSLEGAYSFSSFKFVEPDSLKENFLPNSPEHMYAADAEYRFLRDFAIGLTVEGQSEWEVNSDNTVEAPAFTLLHARAQWNWRVGKLSGDVRLTAKNITGEKYVAFTEPDPDGNSFQPAPEQEYFATVSVHY